MEKPKRAELLVRLERMTPAEQRAALTTPSAMRAMLHPEQPVYRPVRLPQGYTLDLTPLSGLRDCFRLVPLRAPSGRA